MVDPLDGLEGLPCLFRPALMTALSYAISVPRQRYANDTHSHLGTLAGARVPAARARVKRFIFFFCLTPLAY
jgi:hypothetical protein